MKKQKFIYNQHTLQFEEVVVPLKTKLLRAFGFLSAVLIATLVMLSFGYMLFPSPKEKALLRELEQMQYQYDELSNKMEVMSKVLANVQDRDANVHRMIFGMNPIDEEIWNGGVGGHDKYNGLTNYPNSGKLIKESIQKLDKLERQLVIQSKSLDDIEKMVKSKDKMYSSLPAICPIREDKLSKSMKALSGFGMRIHPILRVRKMHTGMDFTARPGTPVQATGDGRVVEIKRAGGGYGNHIVIDHGYGYKTMYAHLSKVDVREGQRVKRGQRIGRVGNSGLSTAPHLHYEVIQRGKKVNPIHFLIEGITPEEYQEMVQIASKANVSFD